MGAGSGEQGERGAGSGGAGAGAGRVLSTQYSYSSLPLSLPSPSSPLSLSSLLPSSSCSRPPLRRRRLHDGQQDVDHQRRPGGQGDAAACRACRMAGQIASRPHESGRGICWIHGAECRLSGGRSPPPRRPAGLGLDPRRPRPRRSTAENILLGNGKKLGHGKPHLGKQKQKSVGRKGVWHGTCTQNQRREARPGRSRTIVFAASWPAWDGTADFTPRGPTFRRARRPPGSKARGSISATGPPPGDRSGRP